MVLKWAKDVKDRSKECVSVTIVTPVPLDLLVNLATRAWMAKMANAVPPAKLVFLELHHRSHCFLSSVVVVSAHLDLLDHLDKTVDLVHPENEAETVILDHLATLVVQATKDHPETMAIQAGLEILEDLDHQDKMEQLAAKDQLDQEDHVDLLDQRDFLDHLETKLLPGHQETVVLQADLDQMEIQDHRDHKDLLDHKDHPEKMHNTVLAPDGRLLQECSNINYVLFY